MCLLSGLKKINTWQQLKFCLTCSSTALKFLKEGSCVLEKSIHYENTDWNYLPFHLVHFSRQHWKNLGLPWRKGGQILPYGIFTSWVAGRVHASKNLHLGHWGDSYSVLFTLQTSFSGTPLRSAKNSKCSRPVSSSLTASNCGQYPMFWWTSWMLDKILSKKKSLC